jgi:hypothetical protein
MTIELFLKIVCGYFAFQAMCSLILVSAGRDPTAWLRALRTVTLVIEITFAVLAWRLLP